MRLPSRTALKRRLRSRKSRTRLRQATDPLGNSVSYRYDGSGNRVKSKDRRNYETLFAYSPNDWLVSVTDSLGGVTSYAYDDNGNRMSQTDAEGHVTLYAYDELGRLTNEKVDAGSGAFLLEKSYRYDRSGNQMSQANADGYTTAYAYDGLGQMSRATSPTDILDYSYDALGRKDSRTHQGGTTYNHFLAKTDLVDYKTNSSGALNTEVVRGPDGLVNYTVHTGSGPVTAFEHFSPHGDNVLVTDAAGNTLAGARYDSFGNVISGVFLGNGYAGKWQREKDSRTGLIDMGVRDYDPAQGRFLQVDPRKGPA